MNASSNSVIRCALIGYGFGGRIFHAPFLRATPGLELAAIVQRKGDTAAAENPGVTIHHSIESLLADQTIDLITVCTPNPTHHAVARQCLQAGRHVVVDKPLTATSADAKDLVLLARQRGRHLFAFQNRRWDGDYLTVRQVLASGALGRLVTCEIHYNRYRPTLRPNTWKENPDGAGILLDLGSHVLDQALTLFGRPESVTGEVSTDRDLSAIDDAFFLTLHYPKSGPHKGLRVRVAATWLAADDSPRYLLRGTQGSFKKFGLDAQEAALIAGRRPPLVGEINAEPWLPNPEETWGTLTTSIPNTDPMQCSTSRVPTLPGDYRDFYAAVRDAVLSRPNAAVTGVEGWRVVRLLELVRQSSDEGRTLPITDADWLL